MSVEVNAGADDEGLRGGCIGIGMLRDALGTEDRCDSAGSSSSESLSLVSLGRSVLLSGLSVSELKVLEATRLCVGSTDAGELEKSTAPSVDRRGMGGGRGSTTFSEFRMRTRLRTSAAKSLPLPPMVLAVIVPKSPEPAINNQKWQKLIQQDMAKAYSM